MNLDNLTKEELIRVVKNYKVEKERATHAFLSHTIVLESQLNMICKIYELPYQIKIEALQNEENPVCESPLKKVE